MESERLHNPCQTDEFETRRYLSLCDVLSRKLSLIDVRVHYSTDMAPGSGKLVREYSEKVVAICEHGYGTTFRRLDLRMPNGRIPFGSLIAPVIRL